MHPQKLTTTKLDRHRRLDMLTNMIRMARTIAVLVGGIACASAFTGPLGVNSFSGVRVAEIVNVMAPARRSIVTPMMGGKENAIR